ncbi:antibiotic ABC transporter permease, partial [Acinetobacter pittii]|nr:antibiotic ABC transporter permease [Acinetobacter pittii]
MWQQLITWLKQLSFLVKKEFLTIFSDPANRAILFVPALM